MTKGVPFDTAFDLVASRDIDYDAKVMIDAWSIVLEEFDGGEFDWDIMDWKKK